MWIQPPQSPARPLDQRKVLRTFGLQPPALLSGYLTKFPSHDAPLIECSECFWFPCPNLSGWKHGLWEIGVSGSPHLPGGPSQGPDNSQKRAEKELFWLNLGGLFQQGKEMDALPSKKARWKLEDSGSPQQKPLGDLGKYIPKIQTVLTNGVSKSK